MHTSLKIIKTLLYSYSALHFWGTLAPIIRSLLILHMQLPVTVCRWVGCVFQPWSVTASGWFFIVVSVNMLVRNLHIFPLAPSGLLYSGT
jgi:hypothetical protein